MTGQVETENGRIQPVLRPAVPQGINPAILILELTLEEGEVGTGDVSYREARYDAKISLRQYTEVTIIFDGNVIACIPVNVVQ